MASKKPIKWTTYNYIFAAALIISLFYASNLWLYDELMLKGLRIEGKELKKNMPIVHSDVLILQVDSRSEKELSNTKKKLAYTLLMRVNQEYAHQNGYEYEFYHDPNHKICPIWMKIIKLREILLNSTNNYKYILYIDTDAVINHLSFETRIESFFENHPDKYFIYTNHPKKPKLYPLTKQENMNAGIFMLKVSPESVKIIRKWVEHEYVSAWHYDPDNAGSRAQWSCKPYKGDGGKCGHPGYTKYGDQGYFQQNFLVHDTFDVNDFISLCEARICNNNFATNKREKDVFVYHFYGNNKKYLNKYLMTVPYELVADEWVDSYNPECNNVTAEGGNFNIGYAYASEGQLEMTTPYDNITYTAVPLDIAPPDYVPPDNNDESNEPLTPNANANLNSSNGDNASRWKIFGGCCCAIAIVLICIWILLPNIDNIKFEQAAEKTTCTIQSYTGTQKECSYECDCHKDSNGHESCSTCYGLEYQYLVTSDLCAASTLHQQDWDDNGACPQKFQPVGHSQKCWVNCNELEYSWASPGGSIAGSIFFCVISGLGCFFCCACAYCAPGSEE